MIAVAAASEPRAAAPGARLVSYISYKEFLADAGARPDRGADHASRPRRGPVRRAGAGIFSLDEFLEGIVDGSSL